MRVHSLNILSIKIFIAWCNFHQIKSRVDSAFKMYRMFQNMTRYTIVSKQVVYIWNVQNILISYYKLAMYRTLQNIQHKQKLYRMFQKKKKKKRKTPYILKMYVKSHNIFSLHIIFIIFFFKKLQFCSNRITYFETLCIVHSPSLDAGL